MINLLIIENSQLDMEKIKNLVNTFDNLNIKLIGECGNIDLNEMQSNIKFLIYSSDTLKIKEYVNNLFKDNTAMLDKRYLTNLCFSLLMCTVSLLNENNENSNILAYNNRLSWQSLLSVENTADAHSLIENLLISINKYLSSKTDTKYSIIANQIKKFIKKNYLKNISVNTIADKLDYSPNYISYIFKQAFAQNISDYITELKISKAKEQLMDLNNKIYFISETLGFSNTSYFCSVFKKYTGLTPREYREKHMF